MILIDTLIQRNQDFAAHRFLNAPLMPTLRTMIIGCVDPRVDPGLLLNLNLGEAIVIRNIGGRITPGTMQIVKMLSRIAQIGGDHPQDEFHIIVLQHTQCGITHLEGDPDILASYFGISKENLSAKEISDPHAAVAIDVAVLKVNLVFPGNWLVSGLIYDVTTGLVEVVVPPTSLASPGSEE